MRGRAARLDSFNGRFANVEPLLKELNTEVREVLADVDLLAAVPNSLLVIDIGFDEKVESVEGEVGVVDKVESIGEVGVSNGRVSLEATELLVKSGLLNGGPVTETRDVLVDAELLDDSVPRVAAREVMVNVTSKVESRNLSISLITITSEMMPLTHDSYKYCECRQGLQGKI